MRHSHLFAIAAITAWAGSVGIAQRVNSLQELTLGMKTIGASVAAADQAISSAAHPDAKAQLVLARQMLASTVPFWLQRKTDEAAKMTRDAISKLDALDKVLSPATVDSAAATAALKQVTATCAACHTAYREGDQQTGYRIK